MNLVWNINVDKKIVIAGILIGILLLAPVFVFGQFRLYGEAGFFVLGGYFLAIMLFLAGFQEYRQFTLIRDTPTSNIRSMPMGTVEIQGKARKLNDVLKSPFSGEECLFYKYEIEEYERSDDHNYWRTIDSGFKGVRFGLDDGTGAVAINPEGAELQMPHDNQITATGDNVNEHVKDFVNEEAGIGTGEGVWIFDERRRYTETYLAPGEEVYIFGYADTERDESGRESPVIRDNPSVPMFMISDKSEKELKSTQGKKYVAFLGIGGLGTLVAYTILLFMSGLF